MGQKNNPPFSEAGCCIISFLVYYHAPPPVEVIIMTTTIIIVLTLAMTLLIVFFNMKDVCFVNIHPPFEKRTVASNYFEAHPDLPKGKATHHTALAYREFLFYQPLQISWPCAQLSLPFGEI